VSNVPRRTALLAAFCALIAGLSSCTDRPSLVKREQTGSIMWQPCGNVECGQLSVPLDWKHPKGPHITLALARLPASGKRIGALFTNPGGPGASGVDFLHQAAGAFPDEIRRQFDLVSWDPRGTGASAPVRCLDRLDPFYAVDRSPDTKAELAANVAAAKMFVAGCERLSSAELPYLSTRDSARDMEAIRRAIGAPQLSYLGFSYGTYLGTLYADMFPHRVRAMVLDGAVDPSLSADASTIQQAAGFERELDDFFTECRADSKCGFARGADPRSAFDSLAADVDAEPEYAKVHGEKRLLGPGEFDIGVANALYDGSSGERKLGAALAQTARGLGNDMLQLSDEYTGRKNGGTYTSETAASYAIGCLDAPSPSSLRAVEQLAQRAAAVSPHFGASTTWLGLPCTYWPVKSKETPAAIHAPGAPPIVVVGTVGDPATPYSWAQSLAHQLEQGRLLTYNGTGHTAYLRGDDCIDHTVDHYLIALVAPPSDTRCD
jgi:pimeloyl-ACP methyl ester carboxylesterase